MPRRGAVCFLYLREDRLVIMKVRPQGVEFARIRAIDDRIRPVFDPSRGRDVAVKKGRGQGVSKGRDSWLRGGKCSAMDAAISNETHTRRVRQRRPLIYPLGLGEGLRQRKG